MTSDIPTFVLRNESTGRVILEWTPEAAMWMDLQAFAEASGMSVEDVIHRALVHTLSTANGEESLVKRKGAQP